MIRYRLEILPTAFPDIEEAFEWIAAQSPDSALRWRDDLFDAISTLTTFPERNPFAPESRLHRRKLRQLLYGDRRGTYRILYEIAGDLVKVLHLRHGARAPLAEDDL